MKWKTAITNVASGHEVIRGHDLSELIREKTFVEVIYLLLKGSLPTSQHAIMFNALFTAAIDHGVGVASAMSARLVASAGSEFQSAVAAGVLAFGDLHGGAVEGAARFFQEHVQEKDVEVMVKDMKQKKIRIPGYGHRVLTEDMRSRVLFDIAREQKVFGPHSELAEKVEKILGDISSKKLPLNIDGAMAAILSDMGFHWKIAKGFFIIARTPGLVAHVAEEITQGDGLRRLSEEEVEYIGK